MLFLNFSLVAKGLSCGQEYGKADDHKGQNCKNDGTSFLCFFRDFHTEPGGKSFLGIWREEA